MARTALLVIDLQKDFFKRGTLPVAGAEEILETINIKIEKAEQEKKKVFLSRDWHPADSDHFKKHPVHCVEDTEGAEFHSLLRLPENGIIVSKGLKAKGADWEVDGYSAFDGRTGDGRTLDEVLQADYVNTLEICGVATNFCVVAAVLAARRLGYRVYVLLDAIRGTDTEASLASIKKMQDAGAEFIISYLGEDVKIRIDA
ncbi:MAG: isochorismatase family protein [bacterium]|nr:isochorismatase family protein [bacterium]